MKKYIYIAAAAIVALSACTKEETAPEVITSDDTFTATIEAGTKTTLGTGDDARKVFWENGDKININGVIYTGTPADGNATKASFDKVGDTPAAADGEGKFNAYYPAGLYNGGTPTLPATQTYEAGKISNLPMYAQSTTHDLKFANLCGVIALTLKGTKSVKNITVTSTANLCGAFTVTDNAAVISSGTKTVTLDCGSGVTLDATNGKTFYIAIPAGSHQLTFCVNTTDNYYYTQTTKSAVTVERNNIYPIVWTPAFILKGVLSGKFKVNSSGKQVNFSQGNLQATYNGSSYTWDFAENQYDYVGNAQGNTTIGSQSNGNKVDLFGWVGASSTVLTGDYTKYGISTSTTAADYGNSKSDALKSDWGVAYCNSNGISATSTWYTLSESEWTYLLTTRGTSNTHLKYNVTVCDKANCLVIAPDGNTTAIQNSYDATAWATAEASGFVCLPAAGSREGSSVSLVGEHGYYWSSSPDESNANQAYRLDFYGGSLNTSHYHSRHVGRSVRLVCTAE